MLVLMEMTAASNWPAACISAARAEIDRAEDGDAGHLLAVQGGVVVENGDGALLRQPGQDVEDLHGAVAAADDEDTLRASGGEAVVDEGVARGWEGEGVRG